MIIISKLHHDSSSANDDAHDDDNDHSLQISQTYVNYNMQGNA